MKVPREAGWVAYAAVFGAAVAVRLVVASRLADLPIVRTPWLDSSEYLDWGRRLTQAASAWPANPPHGPGYPFFLAAVFTLFGHSLQAARFVQVLVGSLGCVLTAMLATRFFGRRAGIVAGVGQAVYGPLVLADVSLLAEGLLVFFLLVSVWAVTMSRTLAWRMLAGLALGCAAITRPTALLLVPVILWAVTREGGRRERLTAGGAVALGCALLVVPVAAKNWNVSRAPMVQAFGGLNFYLGNTPAGDGLPSARPGGGWQALSNEAARHGITGAATQDRYYVMKALREIAHDPVAYGRLLLSKAWWTVQAEEIRDTHSYSFFTNQTPLLAWLPGFGWLFPLALVGLVSAIRGQRVPFLLAGYLSATAVTCVALVVASRYRLPMIPALIVLAAYGLTVVIDLVANARAHGVERRTAVVIVATLGVGVLVPHVRTHAPSHNFAEEWVYTGKSLEVENRLDEAERAYRKALATDERSEYAWDRLGALLLETGRRDEARKALARAVDLDPRYADGAYHLGLADEADAQLESAAWNFRRALEIAPDMPRYRQALARLKTTSPSAPSTR